MIWKWEGLIPRVKTFLWRAIHGGLPTTAMLHARMRRIDPICPRCNIENEFLMHLLFFCPMARATWHASSFPLQVQNLPLDFTRTILMITKVLEPDQIVDFCNLLWQLWKARNNEVFAGKKISPQGVLKLVATAVPPPKSCPQPHQEVITPLRIPPGTQTVLIDASWETSKKSGTGVLIFDETGTLRDARCTTTTCHDPFQAEAQTILLALKQIETEAGQYLVFTDCKALVEIVSMRTLESLPSWQAGPTVEICIDTWKTIKRRVSIAHAGRNRMTQPHRLANYARRGNNAESNGLEICFHLGIEMGLIPNFFVPN